MALSPPHFRFGAYAAAAVLAAVLVSCGGGSGSSPASTPVAAAGSSSITVSIAASPAALDVGGASTLSWSTSGATACEASGAWSGAKPLAGSLTVTVTSAGTYTYGLACSGADGSASGSATLNVTAQAATNAVRIVVDNGPAAIVGLIPIINLPFVDVTVCRPGTAVCQTIDHVLLDTGSAGLRLLAAVLDPALALPDATPGTSTGECAQFVSGFMWGSVKRADVKLGAETALSVPMQQVADNATAYGHIPTDCSSIGANLGSVAALGANGILGVGLFAQDCGAACARQAIGGTYYQCSSLFCLATAMPLPDQVGNPVASFGTDSNGVAVIMPPVGPGGTTSLTGTLIFGIDTRSNNSADGATVLAANASGNFTTIYKGQAFTASFIDSGSNGIFFNDAAVPSCASSYIGFYCPPAPLTLSAVTAAADNSVAAPVSVTVFSPQSLGAAMQAASIAGPYSFTGSPSLTFDWGLPFFYGRTVFVAIEGQATQHGTGPYWAY